MQVTQGTAFNPKMGDGSKGVIQVNHGDTDVTLFGSIDGTNYIKIETFTADTIKEVVLCESFKVSGSDANTTTSIGTSTVHISETR